MENKATLGTLMNGVTKNKGGPTHACSNCGCKRYNPCTCMKPEGAAPDIVAPTEG